MTRDEFVEKYLSAVDYMEKRDWGYPSCLPIAYYLSKGLREIYAKEFRLSAVSSWIWGFALSKSKFDKIAMADVICLRQICMTMFFDFVIENELYEEF